VPPTAPRHGQQKWHVTTSGVVMLNSNR